MILFLKILVIAIPTYTIAILTEQMVFVVPTLVISGVIANAMSSSQKTRVDESEDAEGSDIEEEE